MKNSKLTYKQGICLIILFISGSSTILIPGIEAGNDLWIAFILAFIFTIPIILIYERLLYLFPGKDLFDILVLLFGDFLGKIISILYICFSFHLGTLVLKNFSYFIDITTLDSTPSIIPTLFITLICVEAVTFGIEVMGRWSEFSILILIFSIAITIIFLINNMNINYLRPILYDGLTPILKGAYSIFSFPFGELVIFTMVFTNFKENRAANIYRKGLIFGGLLIFLTSLTDILVLGSDMAELYYFPSYSTVMRISIGNFIERIEMVVSLVFLLGGIIKISLCLLVASKGVSKLFHFEDYRFIVLPMGLNMAILSSYIYESVMDMVYWAFMVWPYYSFVFQGILPIIIYIAAEIKNKSIYS